MSAKAYPNDPYWAARAANFRDAEMSWAMCKTCKHFDGHAGLCNRFKVEASQTKVCDEWGER